MAALAKRAIAAQSVAQTEEATKNAIVMPFLRVLGLDVFDPTQVIPEYVADVGLKKGEKIDYAIKIKGKIEYLVEAKAVSVNLGDAQISQLLRYFHTCDANIGILTNGPHIWFFTDIQAPNKMDQVPFFKFDLLSYDENDLLELEKFHVDNFNIENVRNAAASLKYLRSAMSYIEAQWANPGDDFVRLMTKEFYESKVTAAVLESMKPIVRRAFDDLFRQRARQKIDVAFANANTDQNLPTVGKEDKVETTENEKHGFLIVQAIASELVSVARIVGRDSQSYFAILFDDNNRKPILRLNFNGKAKFVTLFDAEKNGTRRDITKIEDLFGLRAEIRTTIMSYI